MIRSFLWFFILVCTALSCQNQELESTPISAENYLKYLLPLSSDEFQGRKPFTEGEEKTVSFIQEAFVEMGLKPGNGELYTQEVPLVEIDCKPDSFMQISGNANFNLQFKKEFVAYTERVVDEVKIEEAELVFCGFGIVAPEYEWNDYEAIDMEGKIAVVMVNDPGFGSSDSSFFKGNTMTYYGRWTYKYEEAARQGAAGVLVIHETNAAGYPWFVVKSGNTGAQLYLQSEDNNMSRVAMQGWLSLGAFSRILKASSNKTKGLFEKAREKDFRPIPLGLTASINMKNEFSSNVSQNVVGLIEGKSKKDEYIIYCAHWDHLGIGDPVAGDSIYNGALDNASGTASLLAIAEYMSNMPEKPERSIVFLAVTAEEQGLLGSAYYREQPIYPASQTIANLNMDSRNQDGKMKDFTVTGYGQSELDDIATEEAEKQGRYVLPDQEPEKGYFFRSDHFNFAKLGIPALYAKGRYDHWDLGKEYAMEKNLEYRTNDYHRPSDEYNEEEWQEDGLLQDAELYFNIGWRLANSNEYPEWKEGSEFKAIREKSLKKQ